MYCVSTNIDNLLKSLGVKIGFSTFCEIINFAGWLFGAYRLDRFLH